MSQYLHEHQKPHPLNSSVISDMENTLQRWQQLNIIRAVDVALVRSLRTLRQSPVRCVATPRVGMASMECTDVKEGIAVDGIALDSHSSSTTWSDNTDDCVWSWLALASAQVAQGHLCLDLPAVLAEPGLMLPSSSRFGVSLSLLQGFVAKQRSSLRPLVTADIGPRGVSQDSVQDPSTSVLAPHTIPPTNDKDHQNVSLCHHVDLYERLLLQFRTIPDVVCVIEGTQLNVANLGITPFVLWHKRLYLRRYFIAEQAIAAALRQRCQPTVAFLRASTGLSTETTREAGDVLAAPEALEPAAHHHQKANLQAALQQWFQLGGDLNWQLQACAMALTQAFTVITGGPGTGKTTTVVKLLLALQWLQLEQKLAPLQIALAAPTGKAAARLGSSISHALQREAGNPELTSLLASIPSRPVTLHRLLGISGGMSGAKFNAYHPLALDVLVVDEASMIDVELFKQLLEALPTQARLIILGDKDQLASVEAGAILAELCQHAIHGGYSSEMLKHLASITGQQIPTELQDPSPSLLSQHVVMLRHSHRFAGDSGIGRLARAINQGDAAEVQTLLLQPPSDLRWLMQPAVGAAWQSLLAKGYQPLLSLLQQAPARLEDDITLQQVAAKRQVDLPNNDRQTFSPEEPNYNSEVPNADAHYLIQQDLWAASILAQLSAFQVLAALRQGPFGVESLNQQIASWLQNYAGLDSQETWYHGRVVMVAQNDYSSGLMNGDIGICLWYRTLPSGMQASLPVLKVAFLDELGQVRWFSPARVPPVDTSFAMTVHKSQGSEFSHAVLVLPDYVSPVLTRELLYTAVTRAAQQFSLVAPQWTVLRQAIMQKTQRRGGLRLAL